MLKTTNLSSEVLSTLRRVLPSQAALHEPSLNGNEWKYVKECLDTGWVSSAGKFVDGFERKLESYTGTKHAVATVNGTAALYLCLELAGVEMDDEVLMPALTFVATANAAAYHGAIPHFVDSDETTLGVSPMALENGLKKTAEVRDGVCFNRKTGRRIQTLVVVHAFGHPADLDGLSDVCARWKITLIEDAAESLGSFYKGKHTGTFGRLSALSFNGNKIVTTGGGGAVLTNDPALAARAKHLSTTAKKPHTWLYEHDETGYNFRLPNINAALGLAQLEQLDGFLKRKRLLAERYRQAFKGMGGVRFFEEPAYARSNYWLNVLLLDPASAAERDVILQTTNAAGIMTRPVWTLLHRLPMFADCPRMDLGQAESIGLRLINVPSSAFLEVDHG